MNKMFHILIEISILVKQEQNNIGLDNPFEKAPQCIFELSIINAETRLKQSHNRSIIYREGVRNFKLV